MTSYSKTRNAVDKKVVIIGAGPAGLTAAYELDKKGYKSLVLEKDRIPGGLARTVNYKGYHFDIGGHRFFTKVRAVENVWEDVMGDDFLDRERLSRIFYNNTFFNYPFQVKNALYGLGFINSVMILSSYLKAQLFPLRPEDTFDKWVINRFGSRLYHLFFKTYTEKVWGIPCEEISAEWASQRIRGLSLIQAIKNALLQKQSESRDKVIKTLIDRFHYPRLGPGMMWEKVVEIVCENGSDVIYNASVDKIHIRDGYVEKLTVNVNGNLKDFTGSDYISSMPVRELINKIEPAPADYVINAANSLNYRDFLTVALIVDKKDLFPDNWIYIHDPSVQVGRIQNFKNWSPDMVPDLDKTCLGLEYFCFEGDGLWTMKDEDLIEMGKHELEKIGLADSSDIIDGTVVRMPKAYPVYDSEYKDSLRIIRDYLSGINNLQVVGRNGMHKYNNQDHSMLTAMLAVSNILGGDYDLWRVNADEEYHEEIARPQDGKYPELKEIASTQPLVPERAARTLTKADELIISTFARIDKTAFAVSVGTVCGVLIWIATIILLLNGGDNVGANMRLLGQYFIGYTVSVQGAFIGLAYSFFWGFLFGWLFAYLRNFFTGLFIYRIKKSSELTSFKNFIDYI